MGDLHVHIILCCCWCSVPKLNLTICNPMGCAHQAPLSSTISHSSFKFMSIELVMLPNYLILCPFSFCLLIRVFVSGGQGIGTSASASVLSMNFRVDFLLQHHNVKASVLQLSACFMVQLSHSYMIPGKTIVFTRGSTLTETAHPSQAPW